MPLIPMGGLQALTSNEWSCELSALASSENMCGSERLLEWHEGLIERKDKQEAKPGNECSQNSRIGRTHGCCVDDAGENQDHGDGEQNCAAVVQFAKCLLEGETSRVRRWEVEVV